MAVSTLELKKNKAELARVISARLEMEYRVEEFMENIRRLEDNMKIQVTKESELTETIKKMEESKE